jgi:hypothetical protein
MEEERMRDAGWLVDKLEQRLFNRDAEGMLLERLGKEEVRWAAKSALRPPEMVKAALETMDCWLDDDLVLPTGPCIPPFSPDEAPEGFGLGDFRRFARKTQALQLFNSFGVGVFVGVLYTVIGEAGCEEGVNAEISLAPVLGLLGTSLFGPEDLEDSGDSPWATRLERHVSQLKRRLPLNHVLRPIADRHGFLRGRSALLPSRRLRYAQRSMFLAGLVAAGLEPKELLKARGPRPGSFGKRHELQKETGEGASKGPSDLFFLTDEELERTLREGPIRRDLREELEFRLRNNRLSRMLAHLRRISRGKGEVSGDDE